MDVEEAFIENGLVPERRRQDINIVYLNIRSIRAGSSFDTLKNGIDNLKHVDVICLTETWLDSEDEKFFNIQGFQAIHHSRTSNAGGLTCYIKNGIQVLDVIKHGDMIQLLQVKLRIGTELLNIITVYNPSMYSSIEYIEMKSPLTARYSHSAVADWASGPLRVRARRADLLSAHARVTSYP